MPLVGLDDDYQASLELCDVALARSGFSTAYDEQHDSLSIAYNDDTNERKPLAPASVIDAFDAIAQVIKSTVLFVNRPPADIKADCAKVIISQLLKNPKIKKLTLERLPLADPESCGFLGEAMNSSTKLEAITLIDTNINDAGGKVVATTLADNRNLCEFTIKEHKMTQASAAELDEAMMQNSTLIKLELGRNVKLSEQSRAKLKENARNNWATMDVKTICEDVPYLDIPQGLGRDETLRNILTQIGANPEKFVSSLTSQNKNISDFFSDCVKSFEKHIPQNLGDVPHDQPRKQNTEYFNALALAIAPALTAHPQELSDILVMSYISLDRHPAQADLAATATRYSSELSELQAIGETLGGDLSGRWGVVKSKLQQESTYDQSEDESLRLAALFIDGNRQRGSANNWTIMYQNKEPDCLNSMHEAYDRYIAKYSTSGDLANSFLQINSDAMIWKWGDRPNDHSKILGGGSNPISLKERNLSPMHFSFLKSENELAVYQSEKMWSFGMVEGGLGFHPIYDHPKTTAYLQGLLERYYADVATAHSVEQKLEILAQTYGRLERLHPRTDGNTRTSYIWMNTELMNMGLPPAILEDPNRTASQLPHEVMTEMVAGMQRACKAMGVDLSKSRVQDLNVAHQVDANIAAAAGAVLASAGVCLVDQVGAAAGGPMQTPQQASKSRDRLRS